MCAEEVCRIRTTTCNRQAAMQALHHPFPKGAEQKGVWTCCCLAAQPTLPVCVQPAPTHLFLYLSGELHLGKGGWHMEGMGREFSLYYLALGGRHES